jgi:hypothetical protein
MRTVAIKNKIGFIQIGFLGAAGGVEPGIEWRLGIESRLGEEWGL